MIDQAALRELQALNRRLDILIALTALGPDRMGTAEDRAVLAERRIGAARSLANRVRAQYIADD